MRRYDPWIDVSPGNGIKVNAAAMRLFGGERQIKGVSLALVVNIKADLSAQMYVLPDAPFRIVEKLPCTYTSKLGTATHATSFSLRLCAAAGLSIQDNHRFYIDPTPYIGHPDFQGQAMYKLIVPKASV